MRMNSQFCAALEKAVIYTSALSQRAGNVADLQDVRIHTKLESEEDSRCTNYFALHTKEHPQRELPALPPGSLPRSASADAGTTCLSLGHKFPASWSSAPPAGFTPAVGKASNI